MSYVITSMIQIKLFSNLYPAKFSDTSEMNYKKAERTDEATYVPLVNLIWMGSSMMRK